MIISNHKIINKDVYTHMMYNITLNILLFSWLHQMTFLDYCFFKSSISFSATILNQYEYNVKTPHV